MRGQCEIILKNRNNRVVHHEKEHNLVTNFFQEYYKELGPIKGLPYNYTVEDMIGGILLFEKTIEADADNVLLPGGNKMIGNGATGIVQGSGATVKELGTYMADETKWLDDNTYQMKYEWAPSQAVGTIRSVCLTSRAHGFIGEGNENSMQQRSTPSSSQSNYEHYYQSFLNLGYNQGHNVDGKRMHCAYNNVAYQVVNNVAEGKVIVNKYAIPMSDVNFRWGSSTHAYQLIGTVNHNIPEEYMEDIRTYSSNTSMYVSMSEDGKIHFIIGRCLYTSTSSGRYLFRVTPTNPYVYCYTYDIADDSFTSKRINVYSFYNKYTGFMAFYDGTYLLICPDNYHNDFYNNQHACAINTDELTMLDLGEATTRYGRNCTLYRCNDHQFYIFAGSRYAEGEWYQGVKVDAVRGVWSPINLTSSYGMYAFRPKGMKLVGIPDNNPMYFNRHGDYLATIYNLPQAVTKTADLTMQITYTVTFGGGE